MQTSDIRSNILYNIDDIKTLAVTCSTDITAQKICSERYFWALYFIKHNLIFPEENYNNANDWIKAFKLAQLTDKETKRLVESLDVKVGINAATWKHMAKDNYMITRVDLKLVPI